MKQLSFLRTLVVLNGLVPLAMLGWDATRGQLGANSVNNALHITGILSLLFIIFSLSMTPLRWWTGWGGWIAFRRSLGLYGFFYAVVHLLIYVVFDRALSLSSTLHEITTRRFLQVGTVALLLMVPLAATSTNRMIQRLTPRRWKQLHRAAYVVAILGVLHYYMLVKSDIRQPVAFALVIAALLAARVARRSWERRQKELKASPPRQSPVAAGSSTTGAAGRWSGELKVGAITRETPDVKTFRLVPLSGELLPFSYLPGQFLNLQLQINGRRVNRSYTIASSPTRAGYCELTIKREPQGLASRHLHDQIQVGDTLKVSAPSGRFVFDGRDSSSVLLIAGGVGITPLMSIVRALTDTAWPGSIYFLVIARTESDLIFRNELEQLQQQFPRLKVCISLTRSDGQWPGERGRATADLLRRFVPDLTHMPAYICGPNDMMDAAVALLRSAGVPEASIRTEAFSSGSTSAKAARLAVNPSPSLNGMSGQVIATTQSAVVTFTRSGREIECDHQTTVLEAAEALAVPIDYDCRSGICGQCITRLLNGRVEMERDDALSSDQKAAGFILACQARPRSALTVDL